MSAEAKDVSDSAPEKITTPALELLLREKYQRDRYALFFNVPDAVSLDARRRIDAVAVGIWRSVGRDISGFELKVSRSDWLREVKQVDKADPFIKVCDFFWLVTADEKIAKLNEIPACWGWMSATKHGLRVQRPATRLPGSGDTVPVNFMLGILRLLQDNLVNSADVQTHIASRLSDMKERQATEIAHATRRIQSALDNKCLEIEAFEKASGIKFSSYDMGAIGDVVKQIRGMSYGGDGLRAVPNLLSQQELALEGLLKRVRQASAELAKFTAEANQSTPQPSPNPVLDLPRLSVRS